MDNFVRIPTILMVKVYAVFFISTNEITQRHALTY